MWIGLSVATLSLFLSSFATKVAIFPGSLLYLSLLLISSFGICSSCKELFLVLALVFFTRLLLSGYLNGLSSEEVSLAVSFLEGLV